MPTTLKLSREEVALLRRLLADATLPRDALPYTDEFSGMRQRFAKESGRSLGPADFWQALVRTGKKGGIRGKRSSRRAPRLTLEQHLEIRRLLPEGTGSRDRLPYTAEFDELHRRFGDLTGSRFSKRDFWRALSSVAKRSRRAKPLFEVVPRGDLPMRAAEILDFANPWWRARPAPAPQPYRRWAFSEAWTRLCSDLTPVVAIHGPRQVGKTTLQRQIIEQLLYIEKVPPARVFRVQFDEVPQLGAVRQPILSLVRWYEEKVLGESMNGCAAKGKPAYLFFDEVQNLADWAPELKHLVDHTACRVLITGSSSLRIAQGQDSLAGRLSVLELGPLRLREIAGVRRLGELPAMQGGGDVSNWVQREFWLDLLAHARKHAAVLDAAFAQFCSLGGYPVCHKPSNDTRLELAAEMVDAVVARTIEHDVPIDPGGRAWDKRVLREVFRLLCRFVGQNVKISRLRDEAAQILEGGVTHTMTDHAVQFFVDTLLMHRVEPLEALLRRRRNGAKYCLCDHFVREAWLGETVPLQPEALRLKDTPQAVAALAGHLMESAIGYFLKGIAGLDVAWFPARQDEPEIDYVLTVGLHRIPVEVKYSRGKPGPSDWQAVEAFCAQEKYNAPVGLLVTQDTAGPVSDHVVAVPAATFLSIL